MDAEHIKTAAFAQGMRAAAQRLLPKAKALPGRAGAMYNAAFGPAATQGVMGEVKRQAMGGAALGGLLEGGINAATAEEGQRGKAFAQGAAHGAASGAIGGALSGGVTGVGRDMRMKALTKMTPEAGMLNPRDLAQETLNKGYFKTLKDVATGKGPSGRAGSAFEAVAAPAQLAAEFAIPGMALSALPHWMGGEKGAPQPAQAPPARPQAPHPQAPHPQTSPEGSQELLMANPSAYTTPLKMAASDEPAIEPILGPALGGPAGAAIMESLLRARVDPGELLPRGGVLRGQYLPALGGTMGTLGGYFAVKHLNKALAPQDGAVSAPGPAIDIDG